MKSPGFTVKVAVLMLLTASGTHIVEVLPEISSILRAAMFAMDAGTAVSRLFPIFRVVSDSRFPI